jgi:hypothetical protein
VLALHKDAVEEIDSVGSLPVQRAARHSDLVVVEFLLGLYPEAASMVTKYGENLLHLAVNDDGGGVVPKVQYLCSRYPAMMQEVCKEGMMPVHNTMHCRYKAALALYEAGGIEQLKMPTFYPTSVDFAYNGRLPLHQFLTSQTVSDRLKTVSSATSEAADMFRWLLSLYPGAAGIEGGVGTGKMTPYQLAVDRKLPDYYLRLLLRAAPTLNPAELHRLNYAERRMAMLLAFKATMAGKQIPLLARLPKDLKQCVLPFL